MPDGGEVDCCTYEEETRPEADKSDGGDTTTRPHPEQVRLHSWACPERWERVRHSSMLDENGDPFSWCRPPPLPRLKVGDYITPLKEGEQEGERPVCEPEVDGTYPVIGHATCQPLGDPCPTGDWPEIPDDITGRRIYVKAGSIGYGTRERPYGSIRDAVESASEGDVIVIAAGEYRDLVDIDVDLTLWGACVQDTIINAWGPLGGGAIDVGMHAVVLLRNLRISGEQAGVKVESEYASVVIDGVWIHAAHQHGILILGGTALVKGVLVDSMLTPGHGAGAPGLTAWYGGQARVVASTFERNDMAGVGAGDGGTDVSLEDVAIRNTVREPGYYSTGVGLSVSNGARVTANRVLCSVNKNVGVRASLPGTELDMMNVVIYGTRCYEYASTKCAGLEVNDGAGVAISRGLFEDNRALGILADMAGTTVEMEDIAVIGTKSEEINLTLGTGLWVRDGASVVLERGVFDGNRLSGIAVFSPDSTADLVDVAVLGTLSQESDLSFGRGLNVQSGGRVSVVRGLFEENRDVGIMAHGGRTNLSLSETSVRKTLPKDCASLPPEDPNNCQGLEGSIGLCAMESSTVSVDGAELSESTMAGLQLSRMGTINGHELIVLNNPVAVNIQDVPDGYDFFEVVDDLLMYGNQVNLDHSSLPVPIPIEDLSP